MALRIFASVSICLLVFIGTAQAAPTITAISAKATRLMPNEVVTITVKGEGMEDSICAFRIDYGDGTSVVKRLDWGKNVTFPVKLMKQYGKSGNYLVRATGVKSGRSLKCLGQARLRLTVKPPPAKGR